MKHAAPVSLIIPAFCVCVLLLLTGCDFFDSSDQTIGSGNPDVIGLKSDKILRYSDFDVWIQPRENDSALTIRAEISLNYPYGEFFDLSATTVSFGPTSYTMPERSMVRIDTLSYEYVCSWDSLPLLTSSEDVSIRLGSPYWGFAFDHFTYPNYTQLMDKNVYYGGDSTLLDSVTLPIISDLDVVRVYRKLYMTYKTGTQRVENDLYYVYRYSSLQFPLVEPYKSSLVESIDSICISYEIDMALSLRRIEGDANLYVKTPRTNEIILYPNKRFYEN